jgi:methyl-accepting chemotaxis protein
MSEDRLGQAIARLHRNVERVETGIAQLATGVEATSRRHDELRVAINTALQAIDLLIGRLQTVDDQWDK